MKHFYNDRSAKEKRRTLRKNQTDSERKLWSVLRGKQLDGVKFFRQYSAGPYILDFYCPSCRLAVELDGSQHGDDNQKIRDERREKYLKQNDIFVLRFWNDEVMDNFEGVAGKIVEEIEKHS
jgi:very-short-patch-repair endonuclease